MAILNDCEDEDAGIRCPNCMAADMTLFHCADAAPVNSCIQLDSPEAAVAYPCGNIRLGFCAECGFISNQAFDPKLTEYSERYEETQAYSETFNRFHRTLAERLIERHALRDKDIIEIGCGKGEFLMLLCELGNNRGIGFDPGVDVDRVPPSPARDRVKFIADFYSEEYSSVDADYFACKMTLEHIQPTRDFVAMLRRAIGDRIGTGVFFQIPEATRILRECAFEDIFYEHCSYFTPASLARLFTDNGFAVDSISTEYDGQYLTIEAHAVDPSVRIPAPVPETSVEELADLVQDFSDRFKVKRHSWQQRFESYAQKKLKVVLWGASSKSVAFLSMFSHYGVIEFAVDINPYRQNHYLPGSALRIVSPDFLATYQPDVVIIMNPIYRDEIQSDLTRVGVNPEIVTL